MTFSRALLPASAVFAGILGFGATFMAGAPPGILVLTALFSIFAFSFGALMFRDPARRVPA